MANWSWDLVLVMVGLAFGISNPIGGAPFPDDPALVRAAPEDVLVYHQWNGSAEPDSQSANRTERLAAEPTVRVLVQRVMPAMTESVASRPRGREDARQRRAAMAEVRRSFRPLSLSPPGWVRLGDALPGLLSGPWMRVFV